MENTPNFKHDLLVLYQGYRKKLGAKIQKKIAESLLKLSAKCLFA
jgi:hypothetical protein